MGLAEGQNVKSATCNLTQWPRAGWIGAGMGLVAATALSISASTATIAMRFAIFLACAAPVGFALLLLRKLRSAQLAHTLALESIAVRSKTVDRLLEFAQTVQSAGKPEQVFSCLAQFLQIDLGLAGVAVISHEPEIVPATVLRSAFPAGFIKQGCSAADMDTSLCPCLRQNLPREFRNEASPVRCSVDAALGLPTDHPAYCVPFNIGRKMVVLVHMLAAPEDEWTEERRQLAQTYINTASSSLINLHHLSEAEKQSLTDGLTGLYNRRSLDQLMAREVALSERHGTPLSIVMIDMDKFKEVNDQHGHAAGDHMLRAFADCVRITLRKTDLAFRYGGDEFVIGLPQTTVQQAYQVVQKLRQAFAAVDFSDAIAHLEEQPTLSIGVAQRSINDNTATLQSLLAAADTALYEAKKNNRDCIRVYSPQQAA
jgi:diguanylate cyclase (GGDEF)-like protein